MLNALEPQRQGMDKNMESSIGCGVQGLGPVASHENPRVLFVGCKRNHNL